MNWTGEKPTKAGWYWWRYGKEAVGHEEMCYLSDIDGHMKELTDNGERFQLPDDGEWLGPLSPSTYHQGRVAGLKEAEKVAREWPWDRGPAHTNPLHVAKRKGERGASWCIAENIQSMIPLEHQAQGGGE